MQKQREKLSYSRLVSRTKYYQDKALELEKKLFFAEERLQLLEGQIEQETEKGKESVEGFEQLKASYEKTQRLLQETEEKYFKLDDDLKTELAEKEKENQQLNEELERLKDGESESSGHVEHYKKRIDAFEDLLKDVQKELNEKEQQLETYKSRVRSLEKRKASTSVYHERPAINKETETVKGKKAFSLFNYSLILDDDKSCIIRGNFEIENVGDEPLANPYVCFRFYPLDAATLKGKIIDIDKAEQTDGGANPQWVYVDDEWGEDAKERGEIWVRPYQDLRIEPNEKVSLNDLQIPIKKHFDDKVIVEGFVYFQKDNYRVKAANQILITF